MSTKTRNDGHILVEVLLAIAIFTLIASAILGGFVSVRDGRVSQKQALLARGYLDQAVEAVRSVHEQGWDRVSVNGTYYPRLGADGATWELAVPTSPQGELIDGFRRKIVISDVYRDIAPGSPNFGGVVATGGGLDPASKKVTVTVSWGALPSQSVSVSYLLARYENNNAFEKTTCGDFDGGVTSGTFVQYESGKECKSGDEAKDGEIVLAPGGYGNWCNPVGPSTTTVNLSRQGVPTAVWAFRTEKSGVKFNEVFAGTGENASGNPFTNTRIDGNTPNIKATALGDYRTSEKANSVFGDRNYAYIATDDKNLSMMILDLNQYTDPPTNSLYKRVGVFGSGEQKSHNSVYVVNDVLVAGAKKDLAYLTTDKLYIVDVTNKSAPVRIGSFSLSGAGTRVVVLNNVAYVGIAGSATKLQLIDVSNPSAPSLLGSLVNSSLANVRDVYVRADGNRAYIVTDKSSARPEFFIVDTSNKASPSLVSGGSYEVGINARGVVVVASDTIAIVVGKDGSDTYPEYQVIDISDESAVKICTKGGTGKMRVSTGINAISTVYQEDDGHVYSYIVTGDASAELKIIEGGTGGMGGGGGYSGMYESEPIQPFSASVQFNRFKASVDLQGGEVRLWVAAYEPETPGSCILSRTYPYVGPDGTDGTYFDGKVSGTIPFASHVAGYQNPARCIRYKLQLISGGPSVSPVFKDIIINYSP